MATAAKKQVTVTFNKEKDTKNTRKFMEDAVEPIIGTLYVQKSALEKLGNPETLTVTISPNGASS